MSLAHLRFWCNRLLEFLRFEVAMIGGVLKRVFGSANDRMLSRLQGQVSAINALEPEIQALSDADLKAQTAKFRSRLDAGESSTIY